ncbi:MAG: hypothetical protein F6K47_19940 [Symploca sp. SIO2E6]|nr:hypothetical protein [Symploca sp. SIO2E6]
MSFLCRNYRTTRNVADESVISCPVEYLHFGGNEAGGRRLRGRREERRLQGRREL